MQKLQYSFQVDAWILADKHIQVRGQNGQIFSMSEACQDIIAHEKLTDDVFSRIIYCDSDHPDMVQAKEIIHRILKRDFYQSLGSIKLKTGHPLRNQGIGIEESLREFFLKSGSNLGSEVSVIQSKVTMGMGDRNPIHKVMFYDKFDQIVNDVNSLNITQYLPDFLNFETYFVICKSGDKAKLKEAAKVVQEYIVQNIDNIHVNGNKH